MIKRQDKAEFLNVSKTVATPEWALCGFGFSALTETPSAKTGSKRYINQTGARQSVTGYEWSAPFEADQIKEEKALAFIVDIARNQLTGSDAEAQLLQVDLDCPASGAANTFTARVRTVAIAVSEFPDNDGELGVTGDFLGVTDPVQGTYNATTKTFTAGATPPAPAKGAV